ncbi:hypothetical protein [Rhizobium sp. GR12]|uniref:hypothetical protein n=1 Tax=Rhizobium sp. GR12 TaxID=3053925 RepID=UPI002FBD8552
MPSPAGTGAFLKINAKRQPAVGKVLIGILRQRQWQTHLDKIPSSYPKDAAQIAADFKNAQRTNLAVDMDEVNFGTCGIASSFEANNGLRVACSINGATVYFGGNRMEELAPVVKRLATELKAPPKPAYGRP